MLSIDLRPIMNQRGIASPYAFLIKLGFVPRTASTWINGNVGYIRPSHVEKLCTALNCTPNELFHYTPNAKSPVPDHHALKSLIRTEPAQDIAALVRDVPAEKLTELTQMINSLK